MYLLFSNMLSEECFVWFIVLDWTFLHVELMFCSLLYLNRHIGYKWHLFTCALWQVTANLLTPEEEGMMDFQCKGIISNIAVSSYIHF